MSLLESCLRCLSNLYTSSQISSFLVYQLDKQLYALNNLELMLKHFSLTTQTKHAVLNILTISSTSLCAASVKFQFNANLSASSTSSRLDSTLRRFRSDLTNSEVIQKLACLLVSSSAKIQLAALKFYSSVCFESLDACKRMLGAEFYGVSLLELISAYLSRENTPELQLQAAKCLTNLCRCSLLVAKASGKQSSRERLLIDDANSMDISDLITTTTATGLGTCIRFL